MSEKNTNMTEFKLEEALARLDGVVRALDSDKLELEEALRLYEEGVSLVRVCHERLADAERRINALRVSGDGEIVETPFDKKESD